MLRTLLRRLAILPPALVLVHILGFAYAHLVRPLRAASNPFLAAATETEPLLPTYWAYLQRVARLDLGAMPSTGGPNPPATIAEALVHAGGASFGLLAIALALSVLLGTIFGLRAAQAEPPTVASWLTSFSTVGLAMPTFFLGGLFFAAWFIYVRWSGGVLPLPLQGFGWDAHLIMPALVLMLRPSVQIGQLTAGMLADELGKQYVRAARSLGNSWQRIRWKHALRNVLAPVLLAIAGSVRLLVGELIVVEWLFNWPGLGSLLAQTLIPSGVASSVGGADAGGLLFLNPPVVAAVLVVFAALFLITDLIATLLAQGFDPRLRETDV